MSTGQWTWLAVRMLTEKVTHGWNDSRQETGYSIRDSASQASAVYSGVFCLLAIRGARDWRRGGNIQLQDLQDHHIFPQDYLKSHGLEKRVLVKSIVNRTLISDETNGKIKNKSPADYLMSKEIFSSSAKDVLLAPHFITSSYTSNVEGYCGHLKYRPSCRLRRLLS